MINLEPDAENSAIEEINFLPIPITELVDLRLNLLSLAERLGSRENTIKFARAMEKYVLSPRLDKQKTISELVDEVINKPTQREKIEDHVELGVDPDV